MEEANRQPSETNETAGESEEVSASVATPVASPNEPAKKVTSTV